MNHFIVLGVFHFTIGHMEKYLALFNTESVGTE